MLRLFYRGRVIIHFCFCYRKFLTVFMECVVFRLKIIFFFHKILSFFFRKKFWCCMLNFSLKVIFPYLPFLKIELKVFENLYALIFPQLSTHAIVKENFIKLYTFSGFFSKKVMITYSNHFPFFFLKIFISLYLAMNIYYLWWNCSSVHVLYIESFL